MNVNVDYLLFKWQGHDGAAALAGNLAVHTRWTIYLLYIPFDETSSPIKSVAQREKNIFSPIRRPTSQLHQILVIIAKTFFSRRPFVLL